VGDATKYTIDEVRKDKLTNVYAFDNNKEALIKIKELIQEEDTLLIKSSLGMNFIEIYNGIKEFI